MSTERDVREPVLRLERVDACIFDLDGVLTDTASLHERAWKVVFDRLFASLSEGSRQIAPFTADDYRRYVDGEAREDGVRHVAVARALEVPEGSPTDDPDVVSVHGLAADKDRRYRELLEKEGPRPFPSSVSLLRRLREAGVGIAVVSASRHCAEVLEAAGLADLVDVRVDGRVASMMGLEGKPDPAMFLEAARRIPTTPEWSVVVEDALAGVEAGRRGGFGLVVGVDRLGQADALAQRGADVVVPDLGELQVVGEGPSARPTTLLFEEPGPEEEGIVETLCTLANGMVGTRGARPWARDDGVSYPGCYVAGLYDRLDTVVAGETVETESMVNAPNWLWLDLRLNGGGWLSDGDLAVTRHRVRLELERGLLVRTCVLVDPSGGSIRVCERRIVSMASPHLMSLELSIQALDWGGGVELESGIDGRVDADETVEDQLLAHRHLEPIDHASSDPADTWLRMRTVQSQVVVAMSARHRLSGATRDPQWHDHGQVGRPACRASFEIAAGERLTVEKVVVLATSKDRAISEPGDAARQVLADAGTFDQLLREHGRAWSRLWKKMRLSYRDGTSRSRAIETDLFHLLQVASPHVVDLDVGLPARGLHGEGYRGHVFWDTLFVAPVLNLRFPRIARSLLRYRVRRLPAARRAARAAGAAGALFPWQSGSDGRDETPRMLFNPHSRRWMPDRSRFQRHVGLGVAFDAWQHWQASGDLDFVARPGAELIFEVARCFASLATPGDDDRLHLHGVMGPDEFHDGYPWSKDPGVTDNAYTNVMASWLLWRAGELVQTLRDEGRDEVLDLLALDQPEVDRWDEVSRKLSLSFHSGVISQFAEYEQLDPIDLNRYRERYGDIGRLDLLLEAEGDTVRRYQVAKQADVLMLFYLMSAEELRAVLSRMGYSLEPDVIQATVDYYSARVTHGSTLSRVVHAWVLSRADRRASWQYFQDALAVDLVDTRGGATREGVHLAGMAGAVDLLQRCYPGLETRGETLWLNPVMPSELRQLSMSLDFRGRHLFLELSHAELSVSMRHQRAEALTMMVRNEPKTIWPGGEVSVALHRSERKQRAKTVRSQSSGASR